jgi:hypothetical protein
MSSPLGTTVFQVPKLGETGFRIDQVNEQKRKQAQQQLEKEVAATGAEKAYMDNAQGLTGIYKQIADAEFQVFQQSAIEYEKTGSVAAETKMKQAASQLTYSVTAGRTILDSASKEYVNNKANGFKDVALSPDEASELYSGFTNRTGEVIVKNGQVLVKDGDAFVPATQSTYLQSSVNLNNSLIFPRVVKQGTFVDPDAFINDVRGAIAAGSSVENAKSRVNTLFEEKKKDPNFRADILTAYAISKDDGLGMVDDPSKLSADKYNDIQQLADNEEIVGQAEAWYKQRVLNSVPPRWQATSTRSGGLQFGVNIGRGTAKDITYRENIKVKVTEFDINDQAQTGEIDAQGYMALTSNLRGKGYADAGSQNKYDINALAVVDGRLYAKKVVSEGASFVSIDSGRKYTTALEPLLVQEWDALPAETKALAVKRLQEQGLDPNKMVSTLSDALTEEENDVSSQGYTSDQKQWDNLSSTLKSSGLSDEEIILSIGERPKA